MKFFLSTWVYSVEMEAVLVRKEYEQAVGVQIQPQSQQAWSCIIECIIIIMRCILYILKGVPRVLLPFLRGFLMGFDIRLFYVCIYLCNSSGLCGDLGIVNALSDPDFGAEGGGNAPIRWMPT